MKKMQLIAVAGTSLAISAAAFAVDFPEIETNETKAQALANGAFNLAAGDTVSGTSTGTSTTTPGAASADTFLVRTAVQPLGIYRYQLTASCAAGTGVSATIRGLSQSAGVIGTTDAALQTGSGSGTPAAPRVNQWYGFGKQEQLYYRVTGAASSTGYSSALSMTTVTPIAVSGTIEAGSVTVTTVGQTTVDTDFWIYDANLNPVSTFGNDDESIAGGGTGTTSQGRATRTLAAGTYYVAVSNWNLANDQASPADDDYRSGNVMDFADSVANSSTSTAMDCDISITSVAGTVLATGTKAAAFDVVWYSFTVAPPTTPTNPTGTGAATPNSGLVGSTTLLTVDVIPGANPASTGLTVTGDLTGIGGSATQTFYDDGTNGDVTIGDNRFSYNATIGAVGGGAKTLPFTVADAQLRSTTGNISYFVAAPPASFTDLGTATCVGASGTATIATAGEVQWFKVTLPAAVAGAGTGSFVDMWTVSTGTISDTEMGLYDNSGAKIAEDDDQGNGVKSTLSFGDTNSRVHPDGGDALIGQDGALAGGVYWLAVAGYNVTFTAGWQVTTTSTALGTINVGINAIDASCTTSPTGVGSATPASGLSGATTHLGVNVTPGASPASTFANVGSGVTADCTTAGAGTVTLFDDGLHGDGAAGDNTWGADVTITAAAAVYTFPFNILDDQARTGTGSIGYTVIPSPPTCPAGIEPASFSNIASIDPVGDATPGNVVIPGASLAWTAANMVDKIHVSGRLVEVDTATYGTEARFRVTFADATFVDLQPSTVTSFTDYTDVVDYVFDLVPNRSASTIVSVEAFESFDDTVDGTDANWSNLCFAYDLACPADVDDGTGTGTPDGGVDFNDLLYFLAQYEAGLLPADLDDGSGNGVPDGGVDFNDLLYFLSHYEAGC